MLNVRKLLIYPGVFGQVAYLVDALKARFGLWPLIALGVPLVLLFRSWHRPPDPRGDRWDLLGAGWYLAVTGYAVNLAVSGYRPAGWGLYLLLMAPGMILCTTIIVRILRRGASTEGPGGDTRSQPTNKPIE
jgi:hypothetical protein